jgi:hypothetical protein
MRLREVKVAPPVSPVKGGGGGRSREQAKKAEQ